jgi:hypothetical protein
MDIMWSKKWGKKSPRMAGFEKTTCLRSPAPVPEAGKPKAKQQHARFI